jgi:hypothetical protein
MTRRKFIAISTYFKQTQTSEIKNLIMHLKLPEKKKKKPNPERENRNNEDQN